LADFNNFWQKYFSHNWLLNKCFTFHLTQRLLLHYLGKAIRVEMNERLSIKFIYPNLWAPTVGLLQGLTVLQQCIYQMEFKNVCEVKKRLVQPGLVWSKTLSILQSINGESVSLSVFAWWANTSSSFTVGSWKMDN